MKTGQEVDLTGLNCPMPIVRLNKLIKELDEGEIFTAVADDPAFCLDIEAWCKMTGHELMHFDNSIKRLVAVIKKKSESK